MKKLFSYLIGFTIIIFFLVSFVSFVKLLFLNSEIFKEVYDNNVYKYKFDHSQWIVTNKKWTEISDAELYTYAGAQYVSHVEPTFLNFEVPPLGKYIIGGSIIFFGNQRIIHLIIAILCVFLLYLLSRLYINSYIFSLLPVSFMLNSWFFRDQIINSPQLELFQLFFLLISLIFLNLYVKHKKFRHFIIFALATAAFSTIKMFIFHFILVNIWILLFWFWQKEKFRQIFVKMILLNIFIGFVYVIYYFQFFLNGNSLLDFFLWQKWILAYYAHSNIQLSKVIGSYLPLIYMNRWQFWSPGYPVIHYANWSIWWLVGHLAGVFAFIYGYFNRKKYISPFFKLSVIFTVLYSFLLLLIPVWPRYLLILYVLLYLQIGFVCSKSLSIVKSNHEKRV